MLKTPLHLHAYFPVSTLVVNTAEAADIGVVFSSYSCPYHVVAGCRVAVTCLGRLGAPGPLPAGLALSPDTRHGYRLLPEQQTSSLCDSSPSFICIPTLL